MALAWGNSWGKAWGNSWGALSLPKTTGGGAGKGTHYKKNTGWVRERAILTASLQQMRDESLKSAASVLIGTDQPKVKKVVKRLVEYEDNAETIKKLDLEREKLERLIYTKQFVKSVEQQKQQDIKQALEIIKTIVREDMEIITAYLELERIESIILLNAINPISMLKH